MAFALLASLGAAAQVGRVAPSEMRPWTDPVSGVSMTVLTDTAKNDRNLYQTDPMWTIDGQWILFRSSSRVKGKSEKPRSQYFVLNVKSGDIVQVTEGDDTSGAMLASTRNSLFVSRSGNGKWSLFEVDLGALLADAVRGKAGKAARYERFVGTMPADMGNAGGFAVDCTDRYVYITVSREGTAEERERMMRNAFNPDPSQPKKVKPALGGVRRMDTRTGEVGKLFDVEFRVGHIQTSRFVSGELLVCCETGGDAHQRMWFYDGNQIKPLYKETPLDWVTHETFASRDYAYFNILGFQTRLRKQASGIMRINLRTDDVEPLGQVELDADRQGQADQIKGRGFWHCNATRDDKWAAGDTFAGNVYLINTATGERRLVASDCRMKPDHAHPSFSPDGRYMLFQSGRFTDGKRLTLMMVDLDKLKKQ